MSKHITDDQVREIHESLLGTCDSLQGGIEEICGDDYDEKDLTAKQLQEIDQNIFKCETCGWWYEISEMSEGNGRENECEQCNES